MCNITGTMNGVNAKMEKFQSKLIKVIDHHAPSVTISCKKTETEKETMDYKWDSKIYLCKE